MDVHPIPSDGSNWDRNALVYDAGPVEKLEDGLRINNVSESGGKVVDNNTGPAALAMTTAQIITNINAVQYPEGVQSPCPELNQNAKEGKFRYDLEFLLQFQSFCKAKPTTLRRLDDIGLDPKDQDHMSRRGPPNPNRKGSGAGPPSRQGAIGLVGKDAASFSIGGLATAGVGKLSSEERFALSPASSHVALVSGASGVQNAVKEGSTPMTRTASQADPGAIAKRTRTRTKRNKKSKVPGGEQQNHDGGIRNQQVMGLEPGGAPVQTSAKRRNIKALPVDAESPEVALRKIKCLVNKLTIEKFDSISNQIIAWINKLENDTHGYTLIQITNLVVQQAMDEPMWSEMFARLCRKIMEKISSNVKDDSIKDNAGKAIAGGQLFPNHLLSCCKENFERRWGQNDATDRSKEDGRDDEDNVALTLLEGFYAGQKAKQPGLGLVKFIGELFKLQMLKEYTIHNCVKMLLGNVDKPDEEKIEPLCKLLAIVGGILDKPKACTVLDVYFSCMKGFTKSPNVNARMQSMLLDLIELREREWVSRMSLAAAREKMAAERTYQRLISMSSRSRRGSGRGGYTGSDRIGSDGRTVGNASGSSEGPSRPPKAGKFTKIKKGSVR